jgi:L-rhamnose mutarotase
MRTGKVSSSGGTVRAGFLPSPYPVLQKNEKMKKLGFKMTLFAGKEEEYKKRHDEIWPELVELLKNTGIEDYSIFLDEETLSLFGVMKVSDELKMDDLPKQEVMKRWWAYMGDIMASNPDNSPVSIPLKEVFYLP